MKPFACKMFWLSRGVRSNLGLSCWEVEPFFLLQNGSFYSFYLTLSAPSARGRTLTSQKNVTPSGFLGSSPSFFYNLDISFGIRN